MGVDGFDTKWSSRLANAQLSTHSIMKTKYRAHLACSGSSALGIAGCTRLAIGACTRT